MNYGNLIALQEELGPEGFRGYLRENREISRNISFGRLFEEIAGGGAYARCRDDPREYFDGGAFRHHLQEAAGATGSDAFLNISGQIVYDWTLDGYESEEQVFASKIPERPTRFLSGHKIAGHTGLGDVAQKRGEREPYAMAGFGEDWIFAPSQEDWGFETALTWEAIFEDRVGDVESVAKSGGQSIALREEKLAIDCVVDENTTNHRHNWRGTVIASYGDNSGNHTWDNLAASNGLVDYTDIDVAKQLFYAMNDPYTGEPIVFKPKHFIFTKELEQTAGSILTATEIHLHVGGYATTGNLAEVRRPNPFANAFEPVSSALLDRRMATDTSWFLGDIGAYAVREVSEPLATLQAPPDHPDNFHRRIAQIYRSNKRFAHFVVQPRAMVKCTA